MARKAVPLDKLAELDSPWTRQHQRARVAKQRALLQAAASEFAKHGFWRASLDDIAAKLGVSKPTIYYHIGDKDELFNACADLALQEIFALRDALKFEPRPASQALKDFVTAFVGAITGPYGFCMLMTDPSMLGKHSRVKAEGRAEELKAMLEEILGQGVREGVYKPEGLDATVSIIAGALNWIPRWYVPARHQRTKIVARFYKAFETLLRK